MKNRNEKLLLLVLFFTAFSAGIWTNYRQLWLKDIAGFDLAGISRIFSIALICSAVIAFIISLFSGKIKIKNVIVESFIIRALALTTLLFIKDSFIIKTCVLLTTMCEVIFSISYYPLLAFINKTDKMYRKKTIVNYIANDLGIVGCGILLGITLPNSLEHLIDYNDCLLIALIFNILALITLLLFKSTEKKQNNKVNLIKSFIRILKSKTNNLFLCAQLLVNISYGIIYDLMFILLTDYIHFDVSFASIFVIVCNILGIIACSLLDKFTNKISVRKGTIIKFGTRGIIYLTAFLLNNNIVFIISIITYYITSRIMEDKVTGRFLKIVNNEDQFLFGNIRYFITCLGEGIGAFIAGILLTKSFRFLFLGSGIITIIQVFVIILADKSIKRKE